MNPVPTPVVWAGIHMQSFLEELSLIAPPAGEGAYAFMDGKGSCRGWVQLVWSAERKCTLHRLWTLSPGGGNGKMMLETLCRLADRHGIEITLRPLPFGRKPYHLGHEQLMAWYARHGFVGDRRKMIRRPRQPIVALPA